MAEPDALADRLFFVIDDPLPRPQEVSLTQLGDIPASARRTSVRFPEGLYRAILAACKEHGMTKSEAIVRACLKEYGSDDRYQSQKVEP